MKSTLIIVFHNRTLEVTGCSFLHYEEALFRWRFSMTLWGKVVGLLFGSNWHQVEFDDGMDHACIDLRQVIGIKIVGNK